MVMNPVTYLASGCRRCAVLALKIVEGDASCVESCSKREPPPKHLHPVKRCPERLCPEKLCPDTKISFSRSSACGNVEP